MTLFRSKLALAITLPLAAGFGVLFAKAVLEERKLERDVARAQAAITLAEAQNRELAELLAYFSKPGHLEKEARLRVNLKKSGEEVLVIPPVPTVATSTPAFTVSKTTFSFALITDFFRNIFGSAR